MKKNHVRVAGAVLAAGSSVRMRGLNKLLLPVAGKPAVAKVCSAALETELDPVIVVLGHEPAEVRAALDPLLKDFGSRLEFVENRDYLEGRTSSIRAVVRAVPEVCSGALFLRGDQPWITSVLIRDLLKLFREEGAPVAFPVYEGRKGSPTVFARSLFSRLLDLKGDGGTLNLAEELWEVAAKMEVDDPRCVMGVDTREDLDKLER